ncbi:protein TILLER ANGLE CONTROL 1-like isoform X2 [Magnolia sinica]|uniref:protein TILLER ANGLE CONTROL 1-like isoform X2 n=1 Tax=Magnolia sinica TaxID=86752 RepID=UPI002657F9AD|nr:protein TILLER ANGLE CONTROL 1-like isoform X2 [Magnolia sinica]
MKIFDWLHRKLHQNVDYHIFPLKEDSSPNGEMTSSNPTCERDTEALLHKNVNLVDVMDGWHDGILTIGTFGLDQFQTFSQTQDQYSVEEGDRDELNPLADEAFALKVEKVIVSKNDSPSCVVEDETWKSRPSIDVPADNPLLRSFETPDFDDGCSEEKKRNGGRTTLADLFSADAADFAESGKCSSGVVLTDSMKKTACRTKHVRTCAHWKGEDSRPARKLHRMIRRVLKKKIHPAADGSIDALMGGPMHGGSRNDDDVALAV